MSPFFPTHSNPFSSSTFPPPSFPVDIPCPSLYFPSPGLIPLPFLHIPYAFIHLSLAKDLMQALRHCLYSASHPCKSTSLLSTPHIPFPFIVTCFSFASVQANLHWTLLSPFYFILFSNLSLSSLLPGSQKKFPPHWYLSFLPLSWRDWLYVLPVAVWGVLPTLQELALPLACICMCVCMWVHVHRRERQTDRKPQSRGSEDRWSTWKLLLLKFSRISNYHHPCQIIGRFGSLTGAS